MNQTLKAYYWLTKPGIIYGNALTATGGFFLASKGHVDFALLLVTIAGISLIIAAACVINNYIDRGIDKKMARTKGRALVSGIIPSAAALIYATVLGAAGFVTLILLTNGVTALLGFIAIFVYVVLYGISKRRSVHGTAVGSIAGALPPVGGYTAVTGQLDGGAAILFLIMVFWQMPHFYAIAMYRFDDYKAAELPVLPVKRGMLAAKVQIMLYGAGFVGANILLTLSGYTGYIYLVVMTIMGTLWLRLGFKGFKTLDDRKWARKMFFFSLLVVLTLAVMLSVGAILP